MSKTETDLLECVVLRETDKAYQLQEQAGEKRIEWFPKSYVSFPKRNLKTGFAVAEVPLWLLKAKKWDS
jgi:hypothetical protein